VELDGDGRGWGLLADAAALKLRRPPFVPARGIVRHLGNQFPQPVSIRGLTVNVARPLVRQLSPSQLSAAGAPAGK